MKFSRQMLTAVGGLLLAATMTGCDQSTGDQTIPKTSAAQASWGGWVDLDYATSLVVATDDQAILLNHKTQRLEVFDSQGKKVRDLPKVKMYEGIYPIVVADATTIYAQLPNGNISALDWKTGNEKWSFDTSKVDPCGGADHYTMVSSGSSGALIPGDAPLVLSYQSENETLSMPPASCLGTSNASMKDVTTMAGIDRNDGKQLWRTEESLNNVVSLGQVNAQRTQVDQVVSSRGYPAVVRTNITTGDSRSVSLSQLVSQGYTPGDDLYAFTGVGDTFTVTSSGLSKDMAITVDKWSKDESTDPSSFTARSATAKDQCDSSAKLSPSNELYCFLIPREPGSGDIVGALLSHDSADTSAPTASGSSYWTKPGDGQPLGDAGDGLPTALGDNFIPRSGASPLLATSEINGRLQGIDLKTGNVAWTLHSAAGQTASATAPSAQSTSSDSPNIMVGWHFIPGVRDVVVATDKAVIGVNADSGEVKWTDPVKSGNVGMVTSAGPFFSVKIDGSSGSTTRLRVAQKP